MDQEYKCTTCVLLELDGAGVGVGWRASVVTSSRTLQPDGPDWTATTVGHWPGVSSRTFEGFLFNLLYRQEVEVERVAWRVGVLNLT